MTETLRILLVEDDEDDYVLARDLLSEIMDLTVELDWVTTYESGRTAISRDRHDVTLVDYRLGERTGLDLVREAVAEGCKAPIILLTGQNSRALDLQAMKAGAVDYLVKGEITAPLLDRAIRYAIERKEVEERLRMLAHYDVLTGLANRSLFQFRLREAVAQAKRTGQRVAVLLLDLDHFKDINDTLGHPAGDLLLKGVSERLRACARETDTVARLGGDEYAVIATNVKEAEGADVLALKIIDAIARPFHLDGEEVFARTSVGIALTGADVDEPEDILKNADMALYQAKSEGRGTYRFHDSEMNARVRKRKALEADIRRALEGRRFHLHYQPQVSAIGGDVVGAEALLRWHEPGRGNVSPGEFIPVAEATGQIVALGEWVLKAACRQIVAWCEAGLPPIRVAVNLSAIQFKGPSLVDTVMCAVDETGVDPDWVELEITESAIMDNVKRNTETLHQLHDHGFQIAMDDFGTGYSSLSYLKRFPVDKVKIDQSFVRDLTHDADDAAIASAIITLCKSLNLESVAEGVETREQLEYLTWLGCGTVQGYYFTKPLAADEFAAWYRNYHSAMANVG